MQNGAHFACFVSIIPPAGQKQFLEPIENPNASTDRTINVDFSLMAKF